MISSIPTNLSPDTLASPDALTAVIAAIALSVNVSSSSVVVGSADKLCPTRTNAVSIKHYSMAETHKMRVLSPSSLISISYSKGILATKNGTISISNPSSVMLSFSINHPISGRTYD